MPDAVDIVQASDRYSGGGFWSGTEDRHRCRYIAMVPASRYRDGENLLPKGVKGALNPALLKLQSLVPKPKPKSEPEPEEVKLKTGPKGPRRRRLIKAWREFFFIPGTKRKAPKPNQGQSVLVQLAIR